MLFVCIVRWTFSGVLILMIIVLIYVMHAPIEQKEEKLLHTMHKIKINDISNAFKNVMFLQYW